MISMTLDQTLCCDVISLRRRLTQIRSSDCVTYIRSSVNFDNERFWYSQSRSRRNTKLSISITESSPFDCCVTIEPDRRPPAGLFMASVRCCFWLVCVCVRVCAVRPVAADVTCASNGRRLSVYRRSLAFNGLLRGSAQSLRFDDCSAVRGGLIRDANPPESNHSVLFLAAMISSDSR